jgi:hypothetical protein
MTSPPSYFDINNMIRRLFIGRTILDSKSIVKVPLRSGPIAVRSWPRAVQPRRSTISICALVLRSSSAPIRPAHLARPGQASAGSASWGRAGRARPPRCARIFGVVAFDAGYLRRRCHRGNGPAVRGPRRRAATPRLGRRAGARAHAGLKSLRRGGRRRRAAGRRGRRRRRAVRRRRRGRRRAVRRRRRGRRGRRRRRGGRRRGRRRRRGGGRRRRRGRGRRRRRRG